MRQVVGRLVQGLLQVALSAMAASGLVYGLILLAGSGTLECGTPDKARQAVLATYARWLVGLASPGMGETWSCRPLRPYVVLSAQTGLLVMAVLLTSVAFASLLVWLEVRRERHRTAAREGIAAALFMAPPVLWAALITVPFNLAVLITASLTAWDASGVLLPDAWLPLKLVAAILVLSIGGGTIWDLRNGLRAAVGQLLHQDFMLVAQANGLNMAKRIVRNMAVPLANQVAGKVPLLFGEVVVVEILFQLSGAGRGMREMVVYRDAPALMVVTLMFVIMTEGFRLAVDLLALRFTPELKEEVA